MNKLHLLALALTCAACSASEAPKERKLVAESLVEFDLSEPLNERGTPLLAEARPSHLDALTRLRKLSQDPLARGLFVRLGSFEGRFASVDDWAELFQLYRQQKKPVHCHFDELDNNGYALAAHCDRLSMTPAGMLNLVGLAAQLLYGRDLLDRIGVKADMFQVGRYKGAAEPLTRNAVSPEQRESIENLLTDLDRRFHAHLAQRVKSDDAALQKLLDQGPYTAESARKAALVDAIAYDDEARSQAKQAAHARLLHRPFDPSDKEAPSLVELVRMFTSKRGSEHKGKARLGFALVGGNIVDGDARGFDGTSSEPFVRALRRWGDDHEIRAVLLRVVSPGGSALASDRMWHAVRRVAKRKPVIVSLGDMAASGGYYVASAGSVIVAAPSSIVGSIGVVGGKVVVSELVDRLGVDLATFKRAEHAAWLSPFAPFSDGERSAFEAMLQNTYGRFLERVSIGRKRPVDALLPAAEGRVMSGERARELGLVDEVGGLHHALSLARSRGKLQEGAPIEFWPDLDDPLAALGSLISARTGEPGLTRALAAELPRELQSASALARELARSSERGLTVLPFALDVR